MLESETANWFLFVHCSLDGAWLLHTLKKYQAQCALCD